MLEVEQLDRTRLAECQGRRLAELLQAIQGRNQFYTRKLQEAGLDSALCGFRRISGSCR